MIGSNLLIDVYRSDEILVGHSKMDELYATIAAFIVREYSPS